MSFFISDAMAANGAAAQQQGDPVFSLVFMVLIFVVFYFLLIRPQSKRVKEHKKLVESLAKGDEVVTNGGVLGKITEVGDNFLTVEIAKEVQIKIQRDAVSSMMPKGTIKSS
ncbi:MAG: preprotein translocase subunit YajC [Gammaproteobacteria bacterium]|nr:preprotein translocase subunit YajC [Gammaproteobacteria bacterium]MDH5593201.1 preprotein translocase subunit YajC [Gammaproteobacteria bacterium]MDH5613931.1 preprotein translocase subunit YajC [Gammaproteobacteria bacterium]